MKTMKMINLKKIHTCLNFRHCMFAFLTCMAFSVDAADTAKVSRKPAAIEEEVLTVPLSNDPSFFSNEVLFAEDDAGIMRDMRDSLSTWEKTEEYARIWDLKSTGQHNTPTTAQKGKFLKKKIMRYADKRFSGEMKKADEGSTLHKVSRVEKQLRPNASVNVTKNFGFKFKARVLQGKAILEVKNPWIECNATVAINGRAKLVTRKDFKKIGIVSGVEYSLDDSRLLAYVDKQVTDNVKARVSSTKQNNTDLFSDDADARVEMMASFPFNL